MAAREEKLKGVIRKNIRNIRESHNIDPDVFAHKLGISGRILKQIEEGEKDVNDFIDALCLARMQHEFGKNIINELFSGVDELFNMAVKLNDFEEKLIQDLRRMKSNDDRMFIVWLTKWIADGVLKVT